MCMITRMMFKKYLVSPHFNEGGRFMFNRTFLLTSLFASIFMVISLSFMSLFSFIDWSPVGFLKKEALFPTLHFMVQWGILFILLFFMFSLIYIILYYLHVIPPALSAIVLSIIAVFVIEWGIDSDRTFGTVLQSISIPLLSIVAIVFRFIAGTAVFYKELSKKG